MDETVQINPKPKTTADYKAAFTHLLAEINRLEEQMDRDHAESERIKVETQVIKAHTAATLLQLQEQINRLSKAR